jgi:hypothetical protein
MLESAPAYPAPASKKKRRARWNEETYTRARVKETVRWNVGPAQTSVRVKETVRALE